MRILKGSGYDLGARDVKLDKMRANLPPFSLSEVALFFIRPKKGPARILKDPGYDLRAKDVRLD